MEVQMLVVYQREPLDTVDSAVLSRLSILLFDIFLRHRSLAVVLNILAKYV